MAKLQYRKISDRTVEALVAETDTIFWDRTLTGFGVRVYSDQSKVYVVQARGPKGPKRATVGRHGVIGAALARRRGKLMIARILSGLDPALRRRAAKRAAGPTVADLAARYMREHVAVRCKASTAKMLRVVMDVHMVPALGERPLSAVGVEHVTDLHHRMSATPAQANIVVNTLSHMFKMAEAWGLVAEDHNPCKSVARYRIRSRERFLTATEYDRLGRVLDEAAHRGGASPASIAAIRLLMLTGCRCNEILTLSWQDVDLEARELRLRDAKTGARIVPLSPSAANLLAGLRRESNSPWVIPGLKPGTHMRKLDNAWRTLRARAGLDDVRLHDLRHSFASRALALGESLPMIGKLLGHSRVESTARYAHLARDSVHEAAARVADSIAADLFP